MSTLADILTALKSAGLTDPTLIHNTVSSLSALSPNSTILGYCNQILANSTNPSVIKDLAVKIAEAPGVPAGVLAILPVFGNPAATPMEIIQAVQAIETTLGAGQGSGWGGLQLGNWHL